ncbi:MAG: response regulator transcription factor [bacterium]|nr:response regulator transcription factor [bacterium]MBU1917615.1 response regulator transcription factor [bacterium]
MDNEKNHILVVDDDPDILELISYHLIKTGYQLTAAESAEEAEIIIKKTRPHLIILDLMLPGKDGSELCRELKNTEELSTIPIIMLTAKTQETDIINGLELGADDYITKPFSPKVLLARVKATLRRVHTDANNANIIKVNDITIDFNQHQVFIKQRAVDLTISEFDILRLLAEKPGWVFSRTQIVEEIRGEGSEITERSIDVQVVGLRKKLGRAGNMIKTVRGIGYKIVPQK